MESPDASALLLSHRGLPLLHTQWFDPLTVLDKDSWLIEPGFDGSLMGALLPLPQFQKTSGSGLVGARASLIQGMYTIGGVSALPFVGVCLDNWGRRFGMFIGCACVIVGTILGGTANQLGHFLASRFFLGRFPPPRDVNRLNLTVHPQAGVIPWLLLRHQRMWWRSAIQHTVTS